MTKFALLGGLIKPLEGNEIGFHNHLIAPDIKPGVIFVYGSCSDGGDFSPYTKKAIEEFGADKGVSEGRIGMAYAIPIFDSFNGGKVLNIRTLKQIRNAIKRFCEYAIERPELTFYISPIATGPQGYPHRQIAEVFHGTPRLWMPNIWRRYVDIPAKAPRTRESVEHALATHENFYVLTGTDGSGKSTQVDLLREYFKGNDNVLILTAQESTELGRENRKKLLAGNLNALKCAELMHETRVHLVNKVIWPALHKGKVVILDRYVESTLIYQLEQLKAEQINQTQFQSDYRAIRTLCDSMMRNIRPNKMFVLDISAEESFKRTKARRAGTPVEELEVDFIEEQDFPQFEARAVGFNRLDTYEMFRKVKVLKIPASLSREEIFDKLLSEIRT